MCVCVCVCVHGHTSGRACQKWPWVKQGQIQLIFSNYILTVDKNLYKPNDHVCNLKNKITTAKSSTKLTLKWRCSFDALIEMRNVQKTEPDMTIKIWSKKCVKQTGKRKRTLSISMLIKDLFYWQTI